MADEAKASDKFTTDYAEKQRKMAGNSQGPAFHPTGIHGFNLDKLRREAQAEKDAK